MPRIFERFSVWKGVWSFYPLHSIDRTWFISLTITMWSTSTRHSHLKISTANQNNNLLTTMIIDDSMVDCHLHTVADICIPMILDSIDWYLCWAIWKVICCEWTANSNSNWRWMMCAIKCLSLFYQSTSSVGSRCWVKQRRSWTIHSHSISAPSSPCHSIPISCFTTSHAI